jgi:hypothetical protein
MPFLSAMPPGVGVDGICLARRDRTITDFMKSVMVLTCPTRPMQFTQPLPAWPTQVTSTRASLAWQQTGLPCYHVTRKGVACCRRADLSPRMEGCAREDFQRPGSDLAGLCNGAGAVHARRGKKHENLRFRPFVRHVRHPRTGQ